MAEKGKKKISKPKVFRSIDEDVMKGVVVDGFSFAISKDLIIMDGVIRGPRSPEPVVVSRILLPPKGIAVLRKGLERLIESYEKSFKVKFEE